MTPWDPAAGKIEPGTIARQTELMLENAKKVLAAAGADFSNVASSRVYLSNLTTKKNFTEKNNHIRRAKRRSSRAHELTPIVHRIELPFAASSGAHRGTVDNGRDGRFYALHSPLQAALIESLDRLKEKFEVSKINN